MIKAGQYTTFNFGSSSYTLNIKKTIDTDRFELYKDGQFLNGGDVVEYVNLFSYVDIERNAKKDLLFFMKNGDGYYTRMYS